MVSPGIVWEDEDFLPDLGGDLRCLEGRESPVILFLWAVGDSFGVLDGELSLVEFLRGDLLDMVGVRSNYSIEKVKC